MEWKTIDSAPKDGTRFLSYDGKLKVVSWQKSDHNGFYFFEGPYYEGRPTFPTHWMPLPPPPQAQEE